MMKNIIILFLLFCTAHGWAQTEQVNILDETIFWKSTQVIMTEDSTEIVIECEFVTKGTRKIEMKIGSAERVFNIEKTSGTWTNVQELGSMTYYENTEETRIVLIERNSEGLFFTLDLTADGGERHTFSINSFYAN